MAAFLICIFSGGASFDSSFSHTFPFDHCLIMSDLSAYTITYTQLSEHKHIHMWKVTTVLCLPLLLGGEDGLGGHLIFLFAIYPILRHLSWDFPARRSYCFFLRALETNILWYLLGQGNYHIRFSGD